MKFAIVDDEKHCVESLTISLEYLFPDSEIVFKTNKVMEALEGLNQKQIDLLFLDIEMPGLNGFQLLEQLPERNFDVIFTTAYSQYAVQAFKSKAIDYLLKPLDDDELKEAVDKWQEAKQENSASDNSLKQLLDHLKKEGVLKSKIPVPISDGYEFVEVDEIIYCQSQNNYTTFFINGNRKLLVSRTLKEIERLLTPFYFLRIHQSYLINPNYLKRFSRQDGGYVEMLDRSQIPVSQSKKRLITKLFEHE